MGKHPKKYVIRATMKDRAPDNDEGIYRYVHASCLLTGSKAGAERYDSPTAELLLKHNRKHGGHIIKFEKVLA